MRGEGKRMKRCSGTGSAGVAVLPMDIIRTEILCRLPVEPLLRFKSVCKLWYSVIKDPGFIRTHYHYQNQSNQTRPLFQQIFSTCGDIYQPISFNPDAKAIGSSWPLVSIDPDQQRGLALGERKGNLLFPYYVGMPQLNIFLRPVNGFLLMIRPDYYSDRCRMAMLNPATRQFRFLIDFELVDSDGLLGNHLFGYGICKYATTYKVVWLNIAPTENLVTENHVAVAKVYTVGGGHGGDGGWRIINSSLSINFVNSYTHVPHANISMNGKCYWLSGDFASILVFDMDEEVFREMKSPPLPTLAHYSPVLLRLKLFTSAVLSEVRCFGGDGDSLALFVFEPEFIDMSVMDKEEEWHWTRRIVNYHIDRPLSEFLNPLMHPQFPISGSILLKAGPNSFALYNPKTNGCVHFRGQPSEANFYFLYIFNFKESLFSVEGGIQVSDHVLQDFCTF